MTIYTTPLERTARQPHEHYKRRAGVVRTVGRMAMVSFLSLMASASVLIAKEGTTAAFSRLTTVTKDQSTLTNQQKAIKIASDSIDSYKPKDITVLFGTYALQQVDPQDGNPTYFRYVENPPVVRLPGNINELVANNTAKAELEIWEQSDFILCQADGASVRVSLEKLHRNNITSSLATVNGEIIARVASTGSWDQVPTSCTNTIDVQALSIPEAA